MSGIFEVGKQTQLQQHEIRTKHTVLSKSVSQRLKFD